MKFSTLSLIFASGILLFSCKKDERATYIEGVGTETAVANPASSSSVTPNSAAPGSIVNAQTTPLQQITPEEAAEIGGIELNPAHGKPGHRCDIAVGAPLNSAPGQPIKSQAKPQQIVVNPETPKTAVKTAPGMNPPHGEPGHRCDIAVGTPLNSAPAKTAATPIAQQEPVKEVPTGEKPKLNPPHGEPFHDCAIAVGQPL